MSTLGRVHAPHRAPAAGEVGFFRLDPDGRPRPALVLDDENVMLRVLDLSSSQTFFITDRDWLSIHDMELNTLAVLRNAVPESGLDKLDQHIRALTQALTHSRQLLMMARDVNDEAQRVLQTLVDSSPASHASDEAQAFLGRVQAPTKHACARSGHSDEADETASAIESDSEQLQRSRSAMACR